MRLTVYFDALLLFALLGTLIGATAARTVFAALVFASATLVTATWLAIAGPPAPIAVGLLVAAGAAIHIARPQSMLPLSCVGGLCAAVAERLGVILVGSHLTVGALLAALVISVAVLGRTRSRFAPALLREEAAVVILLVGCFVALAPAVGSGWSAAQVLNLPAPDTAAPTVPTWVMAVGLGSVVLGGGVKLWRQ